MSQVRMQFSGILQHGDMAKHQITPKQGNTGRIVRCLAFITVPMLTYSAKSKFHPAGSLEELVENLVKNWEVEASFKLNFSDWRTVNSSKCVLSFFCGSCTYADMTIRHICYQWWQTSRCEPHAQSRHL